MYFSSVGGQYLKAQTQNNNARARCDHYKREVAKKHVHSLAAINKNIRDMQDFLKDIKASSGYFKDADEFRSLYQPNDVPSHAKEIVDFNGRSSPPMKMPDLSESVVKRKTSRQPEQVSKTKFEVDQVGEVSQLRGGETEREAERLASAKTGIRTGKVSGGERGRRGYTKGGMRNAKEAEWFVRDENLMETEDSSRLANISESAMNEPRSELKEIIQKESKLGRSRSFLQTGKCALAGNQDAIVQTQEASQPLEPQLAWTDRPLKKRDSPITSSKVGARVTPVIRSQTALEKASRSKAYLASASVSETERSSTAKSPSSSQLKKLKVHVNLSKTERQRILQELVCSSTVTPERSFLEREKQTLLKDKINTFFKSIFDQPDTEQGNIEEDLFCDDEDLQHKNRQ